MRTALLSLVLLLGASAASAADFSAASLALNPSCVIYQGDNGPRAQIMGSVVSGESEPIAGVRQSFYVDGQQYVATTDSDGYYTADVPVSSPHPRMREGRGTYANGAAVDGRPGAAACVTPNVNVGALETVKGAP